VDTFFPDISEHQPNADIAGIRKQTDAIGVRASYGTRLDLMMPARLNAVRVSAENLTHVTRPGDIRESCR